VDQVISMRDEIRSWRMSGVDAGVAVHSLRAARGESIAALAQRCADDPGPVHVHIAEQTGEVEDCLAATGQRVILAGRSVEATTAAMELIHLATGNDNLEHHPLDHADLDSVRRAVHALHETGTPIDVLIANAGVAGQRGRTAQGFELAFGVNHLGHFALVTGVLDLVLAGTSPRVVVVSSDSHYQAKGLPEDRLRRATRSVTGLPEYARSKLANVLFATELGRRLFGTGVITSSLHPGVVASDVWRTVPWPLRPLIKLAMLAPDQGAATTLHCATSDEVAAQTGLYYDACRARPPGCAAAPRPRRRGSDGGRPRGRRRARAVRAGWRVWP
jgi:NAD(P)-dependent dehydrogenase (short-subunit alcohol dehydrogenase family)